MLKLGGKVIHRGSQPFIIAEIGVNHNGDPARALELLEAAAAAGAHAVKFQLFRSTHLVTPAAPLAEYQRRNGVVEENQEAMLRRLELDPELLPLLGRRARQLGLLLGVTPFDEESLEQTLKSPVDFVKIASGDCNNYPFLARAAAGRLPLIISTGMADAGEVLRAAAVVGDHPHAFLHCVSAYPAPPRQVNLNSLAWMQDHLSGPVGFSDHTRGYAVAVAAVALGAVILEKHLTLDSRAAGPDHSASLEPAEFARYVEEVKLAGGYAGRYGKFCQPSEQDTRAVARKSLTTRTALAAGTVLQREHLVCRRPGWGLPPEALEKVVGRTLRRDLPAAALLRESDLGTQRKDESPLELVS